MHTTPRSTGASRPTAVAETDTDAELVAMVGAVASLERLVSALRRDIASNQRTIELITEAQRAIRPAA